jgi:hypothetical protein
MAIVECKECGGQISQNADTRPHCGDVINERKQQYCIFYVDHLLASGRISPQMTVSVLTTAANATNDNVRLDALRMMPDLLEQKNYQEELKPFFVRSISSLIPNLTEVEVLRRQVVLDIQTLVEAD